jgi:hypothetical protein
MQQGLGGGRCAARCRQGHKGGGRRCGWSGDDGRWFLRQRCAHRGRVGLRDAEALRQGCEGAGRGIAEGAPRREAGGQEDVHPLTGFALPHAAQAALDHLERVGLQGGEEEEQPIVRRRQGTVLLHAQRAGGAGFPIEAPRRHMGLERGLAG